MYEGGSYSYSQSDRRKRKRKAEGRKKRFKYTFFSLVTGCICCFFLILTIRVLAAPDNTQEKSWLVEETISGNVAVQEVTEEQEVTESQDAAEESDIQVVVLDPGHGGEDEGCAREGIEEKKINLSIAYLVKNKLINMGYKVIMTREDDTYTTVESRVEMAGNYSADVFVSIHQNISEEEGVNGMETWYDDNDEQRNSKRLAQLVQQETLRTTEASERELKNDTSLYVTANTTMPACLIETGFMSNAEERARLMTDEYQEQIAEGITQGIDLYFNPKTMYLTFDDGPTEENTVRVLDTLKEKNVKATFFVVGENVIKHPEIAKRIVEEGHAIGIHCYNHNYDNLYASVDSYLEDFEKAQKAVQDITGLEVKLFRFPGGSVNNHNKTVNAEIVKEMTARGYIYYDWNASLEDAVTKSEPQQLITNARETTLQRKKVVMLAHDSVYNTSVCLSELLESFPEYEMKLLTQETEPIQF